MLVGVAVALADTGDVFGIVDTVAGRGASVLDRVCLAERSSSFFVNASICCRNSWICLAWSSAGSACASAFSERPPLPAARKMIGAAARSELRLFLKVVSNW